MKTAFALFVVVLSSCSVQPTGPYDPIAAQCEYEADVAISGIQNPIAAGVQKGQLFSQCMRIRNAAKP